MIEPALRLKRVAPESSLLLLLLAGAFQFWAASYYTVFDDEAFSCRLYTLPMSEMLSQLRDGSDPDPPLYYIIENAWVHVAGVSPLALRAPSILFFLFGCWLTSRAAGVWWGSAAQQTALVLTALHPAHLFFGFAARWYALAFCLVAAMNLLTAIAWRDRRLPTSRAVLWGILCGAAMLTNYFLIAVVTIHGLALLVALRSHRQWLRAIFAGLIATLIFIPWSGPFLHTLQIFRDSSPTGSVLSTATRLLMALLTGNLASPRAWWTWSAASVFALALAWRLVTSRRARHPMLWIPLALILLAILTRTLIDKYVMTISGLCCVALAGLVIAPRSRRSSESSDQSHTSKTAGKMDHLPQHERCERPDAEATTIHCGGQSSAVSRKAMLGALIIIWLSCGIHLISESYWSSLRWLDPMQSVFRELGAAPTTNSGQAALIIASHPSARYYAALEHSTTATGWQQAWHAQALPAQTGLQLPGAFVQQHQTSAAPTDVFTLQTSGFASLPTWNALVDILQREYELIDTQTWLEDHDAELKDRLDPGIRHARFRITAQEWRRRTPPALP